MVRHPGLLDGTLAEVDRLTPIFESLTFNMVGSGEATLTVPEDGPTVTIHDWMSLYNQRGFAGIFRVSNVARTYKRQITLSLLHGIDVLNDSVWAEQTEFSGTKREYLTRLLDQQTHLINGQRPWRLGVCEDESDYTRDINYDRLYDLMAELVEEGDDYYITYDQTAFPWTVNYVRKQDDAACEFRLSRNVRTATVTYNDADLCTRLHLSVNVQVTDEATGTTSTETVIRTYDNAEAQSRWGIVVKTADIDTEDDIAAGKFPEADAWAKAFLAKRSEPSVQIQIEGEELAEQTGDKWDELSIGRMCQVPLPAYGQTFLERAMSVTYPDVYGEPDRVSVSLANALPQFSEGLTDAQKAAEKAARTARGASRGAASAKELTRWSQHVQYYGEALDGSGVLTLYESGIDMDALGGVRIFSLQQGLQALYSGITVNAESITMEVNRAKGVEGSLAESYSTLKQTADDIALEVKNARGDEATLSARFSVTQQAITAEVNRAKGAEEGLAESYSSVKQTADEFSAEVRNARGDSATLSARFSVQQGMIESKVSKDGIISSINQTAEEVKIQASKINLSGYVTATEFSALKGSFDSLVTYSGTTSNLQATNVSVTNTLTAPRIVFSGKTMDYRVIEINGTTYNMVVLT